MRFGDNSDAMHLKNVFGGEYIYEVENSTMFRISFQSCFTNVCHEFDGKSMCCYASLTTTHYASVTISFSEPMGPVCPSTSRNYYIPFLFNLPTLGISFLLIPGHRRSSKENLWQFGECSYLHARRACQGQCLPHAAYTALYRAARSRSVDHTEAVH